MSLFDTQAREGPLREPEGGRNRPNSRDNGLINRLKRIAQACDEITVATWDESGLKAKVGILLLLLFTGTAIPLIPLAVLARILAPSHRETGRRQY